MSWTQVQEEFLKDNWLNMTNFELGKNLNKDYRTVSSKAKKMGFKSKKRVPSGNNKSFKPIEEYEVSPETVKEIKGRSKTLEFLNKKNMFKLNDSLLVKAFAKTAKGDPRIIFGEIVQKTENFITLQGECYKESFLYTDFYTGKVVIL